MEDINEELKCLAHNFEFGSLDEKQFLHSKENRILLESK